MRTFKQATRGRRYSFVTSLVAVSLVTLAACGGGASTSGGNGEAAASGGTSTGQKTVPTVNVWSGPKLPVQVGIAEHLYKGVNVKFHLISKGNEAQLFLGSDQADVGQLSPWQVAFFRSQGQDIVALPGAGGLKFLNGVAIRTADADKYKTLSDLKGHTLGIPGYSSSTWQAFNLVAQQALGIDAKKAFHIVVADPGALLGLLTTGKMDAALLFSAQTAAAMGSPKTQILLSVSSAFKKKTGYPLVIEFLVAKQPWADKHPVAVKKLVKGTNRAVKWMKAHPEAFKKGGKYGELAAAKGWTTSPSANKQTLKLLANGEYFLTSDFYTQGWRDAVYKFMKQGQDVLLKGGKLPSEDDIFYTFGE